MNYLQSQYNDAIYVKYIACSPRYYNAICQALIGDYRQIEVIEDPHIMDGDLYYLDEDKRLIWLYRKEEA